MTVSRPEGHPTDETLRAWRDCAQRGMSAAFPAGTIEAEDITSYRDAVTILCDALLGERAAHTATKAALADAERRSERAALSSIEARNPGIDMDEVRRLGRFSGEFGESSE